MKVCSVHTFVWRLHASVNGADSIGLQRVTVRGVDAMHPGVDALHGVCIMIVKHLRCEECE